MAFNSFSLYIIFKSFSLMLSYFCFCSLTLSKHRVHNQSLILDSSCSHCYFKEITISALEVLFDRHYSRFQTELFCPFVIKTIAVFKISRKRQQYTHLHSICQVYECIPSRVNEVMATEILGKNSSNKLKVSEGFISIWKGCSI